MLYLIKCDNFLKIGYTSNLENRLKHYHTHNPNFEILYTRKGDKKDEHYLHKLLSKYKIDSSEWYKYSPYIIKVFKNYEPYKLDQEYNKNIITDKYVLKLLSGNDKLKQKRLKKLINEGKLIWSTDKGKVLKWT